jgi:hypothetical protein
MPPLLDGQTDTACSVYPVQKVCPLLEDELEELLEEEELEELLELELLLEDDELEELLEEELEELLELELLDELEELLLDDEELLDELPTGVTDTTVQVGPASRCPSLTLP